MNPLVEQLTHRAFPELARTLRAQTSEIIMEWEHVVRNALPQLDHLTFDELRDNLPRIIPAVADAMSSDDPRRIADVLEKSPAQGLTRFAQNYQLAEIMEEDRLLRGVIVAQLESSLGRQMTPPEAAALHAVIDIVLQQAVLALVDQQKAQLRRAVEDQLKYLSFLSHDLNNNLETVMLTLEELRQRLRDEPRFAGDVESVAAAQNCIRETVDGMRRLTSHETLRHRGGPRRCEDVRLEPLSKEVAAQFARPARAKGVQVISTVMPTHVVRVEPDLLRLVLQNLVGNAVKYSSSGRINIHSQRVRDASVFRWEVSVSDQGPGIPPEQRDRLFRAFSRGETFGTEGLGLGLSIVSQAARLLDADLRVESEPGRGTTIRLLLPTSAIID